MRAEKRLIHRERALNAPSIHQTLKELRLALGMSLDEMADALLPHLPAGKKPSAVAIHYWEQDNRTHQTANLPSRKIFAGTDPITAYGEVFKAHDMGDWFAQHDSQLRELLLEAMNHRKSAGTGHELRWNSSRVPEDCPAFWDEYVKGRTAASEPQSSR